jgi:hypothetical protein
VEVFVEIVENVVEYFGGGDSDGVEGGDDGSGFNGCFVDFGNRCEEWDGGWVDLVVGSEEGYEVWRVDDEELEGIGRECSEKLIVGCGGIGEEGVEGGVVEVEGGFRFDPVIVDNVET